MRGLIVFAASFILACSPAFGQAAAGPAPKPASVLLAQAAAASPVLAQSAPAAKPEFDLAVIRRHKGEDAPVQSPGQGQGGVLPGGQFSMRNATLKMLLGYAFNPSNQRFRDSLIVGAPGWADSDRFDIVGKAPPDVPPRECFFSGYCLPNKTLALMLQTFLENEFKMVVHQEQRPTDEYALVVGKGGMKFQKAAGSGERNCRRIVGGSDDPAAKGLSAIEAGFVCANMTMEDFAGLLPEMAPAYLDREVVDLTGLKGAYDFRLTWVGAALIDQGGLTLFDALGKQMGLKLESRKLPMPVNVIDHVEKLADDN
jgi:uncharacterized protein (TIGR03435 family)